MRGGCSEGVQNLAGPDTELGERLVAMMTFHGLRRWTLSPLRVYSATIVHEFASRVKRAYEAFELWRPGLRLYMDTPRVCKDMYRLNTFGTGD